MKIFIYISVILVILSSCGKPFCKECDANGNYIPSVDANGNIVYNGNPNSPHIKVCRDQFDSNEEYKDYISYLEWYGYSCKSDLFN